MLLRPGLFLRHLYRTEVHVFRQEFILSIRNISKDLSKFARFISIGEKLSYENFYLGKEILIVCSVGYLAKT